MALSILSAIYISHFIPTPDMSWKVAFTVALLTALVAAVVTVIAATLVAEANGISDREGSRSMEILFLLMPVGFVVGFVFGLVGTRLVHAVEWAQFWKATGLSVGMALVALLAIAGYFTAKAPITPPEGGSPLALQVEFHIPTELMDAHPEAYDPLLISLYAGPRDNFPSEIDTALTRTENGMLIVTALAGLNSDSYVRTFSLTIDTSTWLTLDQLPIASAPSEKDSSWSALLPMRDARTAEPFSPEVRARVRVVKRDR